MEISLPGLVHTLDRCTCQTLSATWGNLAQLACRSGLHAIWAPLIKQQRVYVMYIFQECARLLKELTVLEEDVMKEHRWNGHRSCYYFDNLLEACELSDEIATWRRTFTAGTITPAMRVSGSMVMTQRTSACSC